MWSNKKFVKYYTSYGSSWCCANDAAAITVSYNVTGEERTHIMRL
jgi:hypothetical protein